MKGNRGKLPSQFLSKITRKKKTKVKFLRKSVQSFKFTGKDIGELSSVVVEVRF